MEIHNISEKIQQMGKVFHLKLNERRKKWNILLFEWKDKTNVSLPVIKGMVRHCKKILKIKKFIFFAAHTAHFQIVLIIF
jgi:hypothetical protein